MSVIKKLLKIFVVFLVRARCIIGRLKNLPSSYRKYVRDSITYYPELEHKSKLRLWCDYAVWYLRTGDVGLFFRAYGFDIKGRKADPTIYLDENFFWHKIIDLAYRGQGNYAVVLRDKNIFDMYMRMYDIPTPPVIAYTNASGCYIRGKKVTLSEWVKYLVDHYNEFFFKGAMSCCGRDVVHVIVKDGQMISDGKNFEVTDSMVEGQNIVVQTPIKNCKEIAAINPYAVSTIRMVTVMGAKSHEPELLCPGYMRIGCKKDSAVDNLCVGGVGVGLTSEGKLMPYGLFKPWIGEMKCYKHPLSGVVFDGYSIPFYEEACSLVKRAHRVLPTIPTIGWDVAITENGPTLIEGNDNWEISGVQIPHGGVKKRLMELLES